MEIIPILIIGVQILAFAVIAVLLIYLIVRRIETKQQENFEDRDN